MNKKILFAALSIAALTACSTDDFESQNVAEGTSPIKFEVINNQFNDLTRASMSGNKIVWNADDGDLFTLYHGATLGDLTGYENATYTANANEGGTAYLTTPSMIKEGGAIMVWPVDSTFRIGSGDALTITIPAEQTNIENNIPYMSDLVSIGAYDSDAPYNTAGLDRSYPVYMRPMASQLIIKADYDGTDETIAELEEGDDPIDPIEVTSVDLLTYASGSTLFTTEIPVKWTDPSSDIQDQWDDADDNHAWTKVTDFDIASIASTGQTDQLTATDDCVTDNYSCKFLILPQATISSGVEKAAVVVNTIYGKVVVADPTEVTDCKYVTGEYEDAWYRYISDPSSAETGETAASDAEESGDYEGKYKTTSVPAYGMQQTLNGFSAYTATSGVVEGEPVGAAATRFVKVLLTHLDMSDLHIDTDKQLRDAARVWQKLGLDPVTVYLDGDENEEFEISQTTIEVINEINEDAGALSFQVMPCDVTDEECSTIVITGADTNAEVQDIAFIQANGSRVADVVLADEETAWNWVGTVKVTAAGVNSIINKGTMANAETATLMTTEYDDTQNNVPLVNDGTWNITAGTLNVQFDVTNNGEVNISSGAQYRQDNGSGLGSVFTNDATALPTRFGGDDALIGLVNNSGVFATVAGGEINNYGLIEHADEDAKTYVTTNQLGGAFGTAFGAANKMGRINLPFSNKDEDNISVSAALAEGFISVTVDGDAPSDVLNASVVGSKVNYIIVKSGINTISDVSAQVEYLEINESGTEIAWAVTTPTTYAGLMVLSDVNIKLGTSLTVTDATYLGSDMYVGGTFTTTSWSGYYGDTSANVATKYITY